MHRRRVAAGIALLVVALVVLIVALFVQFPVASRTVVPETAWTIHPWAGAPIAVTVRWTGGTAPTHAYLVTGTPDCLHVTGVQASGTGASGSFAAHLAPGTTYSLYACAGDAWQTVTFTLLGLGNPAYVEPLEGTAAVLGFSGILLVFLGYPIDHAPTLGRSRRGGGL
ncbi:MAG TPA: hypothetical protein VML53_01685 [Thermoplasmata archaeon]|nr:hypothetical protein [Thermoplasmata archaeon]